MNQYCDHTLGIFYTTFFAVYNRMTSLYQTLTAKIPGDKKRQKKKENNSKTET